MKFSSITILFFVVSCFSIWRILLRIKRETIGIRSGVIWILLWAGIGLFSIFPELLNTAMRMAQMKNRMFFILVLAVFILFALLSNLASRMDNIQRSIRKMAREIARIDFAMQSKDKSDNKEEDQPQ
jgi:hypothetical protein